MKPLAVQMKLAHKRLAMICRRANATKTAEEKIKNSCCNFIKSTYNDGLTDYPLTREKMEEMAYALVRNAGLPEDVIEKTEQVFSYHIRWAHSTGLIDNIDPRMQSIRPELLLLLDELDNEEV